MIQYIAWRSSSNISILAFWARFQTSIFISLPHSPKRWRIWVSLSARARFLDPFSFSCHGLLGSHAFLEWWDFIGPSKLGPHRWCQSDMHFLDLRYVSRINDLLGFSGSFFTCKIQGGSMVKHSDAQVSFRMSSKAWFPDSLMTRTMNVRFNVISFQPYSDGDSRGEGKSSRSKYPQNRYCMSMRDCEIY